MRQLAACAALLWLAACQGNPDFQPFDSGTYVTPSSGGSSGGATGGGSSGGGGSTGGGLCGAVNGVACSVDGGGSGLCCGGACTSSQTDPLNCGGCFQACPSGASCAGGSCTGIDGGPVSCQDAGCAAGLTCVGSRCLSSSCSAGSQGDDCALDGGVAGICCGSGCTNPLTDDQNCGTCNNQCSSGDFCSGSTGCQPIPACGPAELGITCPLGDAGVNGVCCNQGCTATLSDTDNCGLCGAVCPNGTSCVSGSCLAPDAGLVSCFDGGTCPAGTGCVGTYCLTVGCQDAGSGAPCLFGVDLNGSQVAGLCCGISCVDIDQNPDNCRGCGVTCASQVCAPGPNACLPPPGTDGGSCQTACTPEQSCVGSQCVDDACGNFFDMCQNPDAGDIGICCPDAFGDSVCADISFDSTNCGGCGLTCPEGQGCNDGVCSGSGGMCGPGTVGMYCNFDAGPSFLCCPGRNCTDTRTDTLNCGGCSIECPEGTYCIEGTCLATSCGADSGAACQLVDGGIGGCCNSACLDELHDPANCGACQNPCAAPNGSCDFGVCGVATCTATSLGVPCPADGVAGLCCASGCIDTDSDPSNCGNCGIVCPGDAGCFAGNCQ